MPELTLLLARKDGETLCGLKSELDADGVTEEMIRESFGDDWRWMKVEAKVPLTRDKLAIDRECVVYPANAAPYTDPTLQGQKRFVQLVTSVDGRPPTEEMYLELPPLVSAAIDAWLVGKMFAGLTQDKTFSTALSRLLSGSGAANPSAS